MDQDKTSEETDADNPSLEATAQEEERSSFSSVDTNKNAEEGEDKEQPEEESPETKSVSKIQVETTGSTEIVVPQNSK